MTQNRVLADCVKRIAFARLADGLLGVPLKIKV